VAGSGFFDGDKTLLLDVFDIAVTIILLNVQHN